MAFAVNNDAMTSVSITATNVTAFQGIETNSPKAPSTQAKGQLNKKAILAIFRALVFMIISVLLFFNNKTSRVVSDPQIAVFFLVYFLSVVSMIFIKPKWLDNKKALPAVFLVDTVFITVGIYLAGMAETDLFLVFFTTVFISALSQDVKSVFWVATVSCSLYGFMEYKATGEFITSDTAFLVRFPFLFVAAAMSGFLAMETKKQQEERSHLLDMNQFLAEQADSSMNKLMETNRKLKTLLEYHHCVLSSIKTGIIVVRKDGKIRTFNSGARQITGFVEAEMAEKELDELPENLKPVAQALKCTLEDEKTVVQDNLELKTIRSEMVPVTLETSVLRGGNGEVIGAIATLKDVTLFRQMETQLLRSERFSALGEMAAGVAHEIKNPLNAVMGFSKRLSAKLEEPTLKKYADIIAEEVVRMDTIVNDVLEYSRPDRVSKSPVDVQSILEEACAFLAEKFAAAKVTLVKDFTPGLPDASLDTPKIRQVVLNLILNAIQAMPKGGTLTLGTRLIEGLTPQNVQEMKQEMIFQQLFLQQKMVAVSVRDTGCGIAKENLVKLFHPFFTTKITGTGLGLSICHKIIAAHGGMLDVQSVVGGGSTFTFYIPLGDE
jgi:two-component system, NtrC family, nitrogen regulation sensor histidine kinase GlnL